jgi:hypothetical protein
MSKLASLAKSVMIILVVSIILFGLIIVIAKIEHYLSANSFWSGISENFTEILMAVLTIAAITTALFKETFIGWFYHPDLTISVKNGPPDCHKSPVTIKYKEPIWDGGVVEGEETTTAYYFRLWVMNEGTIRAEKVQVYAAKLRKLEEGSFQEVRSFLPMNLKWAHTDEVFADGISPRMGRHCDFGKIINPAAKRKPSLPHIEEDKTVLELSLEVAPFTKSHLLEPGSYELDLQIAAANSKSKTKILKIISFAGDWYDNEREMFSKGIKLKVID